MEHLMEHPEYKCPSCSWEGDEPIECLECECRMCPTCHGEVMLYHKWLTDESINQHDAELEDVRLER